jgi:cytoskeleton-associated protein 5
VAEAKSSAAAYRERLAQIQDNVGADVAAPTKVVDVDEAMTDLQRLRQRMNSINAKAAGTM